MLNPTSLYVEQRNHTQTIHNFFFFFFWLTVDLWSYGALHTIQTNATETIRLHGYRSPGETT